MWIRLGVCKFTRCGDLLYCWSWGSIFFSFLVFFSLFLTKFIGKTFQFFYWRDGKNSHEKKIGKTKFWEKKLKKLWRKTFAFKIKKIGNFIIKTFASKNKKKKAPLPGGSAWGVLPCDKQSSPTAAPRVELPAAATLSHLRINVVASSSPWEEGRRRGRGPEWIRGGKGGRRKVKGREKRVGAVGPRSGVSTVSSTYV